MSVIKWLDDHLEETVLVFMLATISCVMMLQVILRTVSASLTWPEEFCRYCYVWSVFLSIGYTIKKGNMLRVSVVMDLLPTRVHNAILIVVDLIMIGIFGVFFYYAVGYVGTVKNIGQYSPAVHIPMWIMYCSTAIGFGLATIRSIQSMIHRIRHFNDKDITTLEAARLEAEETVAEVLSDTDPLKGGNA